MRQTAPIPAPTPSVAARFWSHVQPDQDCWIWTGATRNRGYGCVTIAGRLYAAHRVSYTWTHGPIPDGLELDHLCRNPVCVNPLHLEAVSRRTNLLRGDTHAAANSAKTHCPAGHPYDAANTYVKPNGARCCRTCLAAAFRRYRASRRQVSRRSQF